MYRSIVVGTDGSPTAQRAVARAVEIAKLYGATLHMVSAFQPASVHTLASERANLPSEFAWQVSATSEVDGILARAKRLAADSGLEVEGHASAQDPVDAILSIADAVEADLVVVGSKGMERRVLGSIPNSISHRASTDVLIVATTT